LLSDRDGLRVFDGPPSSPKNFRVVAARVGNKKYAKPAWNLNTEADIDHYAIYRNLFGCGPDCGNYDLIATVGNGTSSYIDMEVEINFWGASDAYYFAVAVDNADLTSAPSRKRSVPTNIVKKSTAENNDIVPDQFLLLPNYPNPFNPETEIKFGLPVSSNVSLMIYNLQGQEIKTLINGRAEAGYKHVKWNGTNESGDTVGAGIYIYRIQAYSLEDNTQFSQTRKMILLK
jgi:hypothetical protein